MFFFPSLSKRVIRYIHVFVCEYVYLYVYTCICMQIQISKFLKKAEARVRPGSSTPPAESQIDWEYCFLLILIRIQKSSLDVFPSSFFLIFTWKCLWPRRHRVFWAIILSKEVEWKMFYLLRKKLYKNTPKKSSKCPFGHGEFFSK